MVQQYENNIILPPPEFQDGYKPIPLPRTKKPLQTPIPTPRTKKQTSEKPIFSCYDFRFCLLAFDKSVISGPIFGRFQRK